MPWTESRVALTSPRALRQARAEDLGNADLLAQVCSCKQDPRHAADVPMSRTTISAFSRASAVWSAGPLAHRYSLPKSSMLMLASWNESD
jgi:hypothetical protein